MAESTEQGAVFVITLRPEKPHDHRDAKARIGAPHSLASLEYFFSLNYLI